MKKNSKKKIAEGLNKVVRDLHLPPEERDYLERLLLVRARALDVFGDKDNSRQWLREPVPALGGKVPESLLHTAEGFDLVMATLSRIEHGIHS